MKTFRRRRRKYYAFALAHLMLLQIVQIPVANALTSGASQPEASSFEPVGTTDMVDLFTGDFTYNIPLFELPGPNGGYPFNLAYHAGIGLDDEASWTGLGWNLNPGSISRQMRGIPDEFKGDNVHTTMSMEPNVTAGIGAGAGFEIFGGVPIEGGGSFGVNIHNNSYNGVGYSIEAGLGLDLTTGNGNTASLGLDLSLDPRSGISASPSLGLGNKLGDFGLRSSYNSREGLMDVSSSIYPQTKIGNKSLGGMVGIAGSLSLAHPGYSPQIPMPMINTNLKARIKLGISFFGVFANSYVDGFYNESRLVNDGLRIPTRAYGYLNYQHAGGEDYTMDMNREKDGMVNIESPNLAVPSLTYDIYSLTGQGIAGMFRPVRTDFGILGDAPMVSRSVAGSAAGDAGPKHVGLNLGLNYSKSTSGAWSSNNDLDSAHNFRESRTDDPYEPWYFKVHGEHQGESMANYTHYGGEEAVRFRLTGQMAKVYVTDQLENNVSVKQPSPGQNIDTSRKTRNQSIIAYTNGEIMNDTITKLVDFRINYLDTAGILTKFERDTSHYPAHHWAGYTAISPEGLRYNYALPAYNRRQVEVAFSTVEGNGNRTPVNEMAGSTGLPFHKPNGTDKFLKQTEVPDYAHSYLLTSIVGPDYVDVDGNGVSEKDLGYWVKFTYQQITEKEEVGEEEEDGYYNWRDPFFGAHLDQGLRSDPLDDRGTFVYGEKEIWYLAMAETKTHIARFGLQDRKDATGADNKLQDSPLTGKKLKKLNSIVLYTREGGESNPIKKVRFGYDYSLCQDIPNYIPENGAEPDANNKGKLTLKKLWFEYGNSQRGSLNPYEFSYNNENDPLYKYQVGAYDRWGNYKPLEEGDSLRNQDLPYVNQDPENKEMLDSQAGAWSLNEIHLPSGGRVKIDYETDDYAYVQHKQAMAMVPLVSPDGDPWEGMPEKFTLNGERKIRFPLRHPVPATLDSVQQKTEVLRYLDTKTWQLFFKIYVNLRAPGEDFFEFVQGYVDVDRAAGMGLEKAGEQDGEFAYGFFHLMEDGDYHPLSLRTWQHVRTNQPDLANIGRKLKPAWSKSEKISQIRSLPGLIPQIRQVFGGYENYCFGKNWGRTVDSDRSVIRLKSPNRMKYGGGLRVKQITMTDEWGYGSEGVYGQYYEYTTMENGETLSSGVAAYEPFIGGEENSLRYAKIFNKSVPLKSDNNLYFEYPVNESYFPGPQVGYGKVTVMSLASAKKSGKAVLHLEIADGGQTVPLFPEGNNSFGTTGATVHEFYTARDFPVRSYETEKSDKDYRLDQQIPFAGRLSASHLTSSQGYSIVTNDMHGKPRRISQYRQNPSGTINPDPISWVRYNYFGKTSLYQREKVMELSNSFVSDSGETVRKATPEEEMQIPHNLVALGQETEFFADMREHRDATYEGGANLNVDLVFFAPIPSAWPSVGKTEKQLRTVVTNKIVFQPGILQSTEAYDEGSLLLTEHLKWDRVTGAPLLTVVNNNFDDPVYTLDIPAFHRYAGMGGAYKNLGYVFSMHGVRNHNQREDHFAFHTPDKNLGILHPGDELLLFDPATGLRQPLGKAVFLGEENGEQIFHVPMDLQLQDDRLVARIVRSGYRNQLQVMAGSIRALEVPGTSDFVHHGVTIQIPEGKYLD